eukprot:4392592-Pleurochrysis_carterae.AAC.1
MRPHVRPPERTKLTISNNGRNACVCDCETTTQTHNIQHAQAREGCMARYVRGVHHLLTLFKLLFRDRRYPRSLVCVKCCERHVPIAGGSVNPKRFRTILFN